MLQFVSSNSWTKKEEIDSKSAQSLFYKNLEYYFKMKEPTSVEHKEYVVSP